MQTRSHKATNLVALSNEELGRLERSQRKATKPAEMNPQDVQPEGANLPAFVPAEGGNNPQGVPPAAVRPIGPQLGLVDPRAPGPIDPPPGPIDPLAAARPARTLGEQDTPDRFYANRSALRPPNPTRQDYEIKYSLINLVQNRCFNGLPTENPMDHIEAFEALCRTTKANGVPYDYLRLTLFEFSLGGKAQRWLKMLEPGSITTWEACRAKFLNHFYTKARSARMRNQIVAFKQKSTETFNEAWERFKEYVKDCPHHGYTQESLMTTFYGGIDTQYQMALDTASKGDFSTNTVAQATALIENLARSNSDHAPEYDRSVKVKAVETEALKDLTQKVNLLLAREQQPLKACDVDEDEDVEELNYVGGYRGGFNPNYRNHPNLSYRSNNVENPQDMVYPPRQQGAFNKPAAPQENKLETMMHSLIESHKKSASEINAKIDGMYGDLNGKFTTLATRVDSLDKRVSSMASSSKGKEACNAVMTHSGVNTSFKTGAFGDLSDFQKPGSTDLSPRSIDPPAGFTLLTREVRSTDPHLDRSICATAQDVSGSITSESDAHFIAKADVLPYKPQRPYSSMPKAKIDDEKYNRFKSIIGELIKEATFSEALGDLPFLKKICKDVIDGVEDPAEVDAYLAKRKEARTPRLVKVEKQEDPGKFVVPCSIDGEVFANSLCDSGSSVNVMSMATVRRLDLQGMKTSKCSLKFANASTTNPQGFLGDVEVRVGNHIVPTDFHVVEMSGGSETPLILGRAFLTTVGAVFDLEEPKMIFTKIDKGVAYYPVLEANRLRSNFAEVCMVRMRKTPRVRVNYSWPYPATKRRCECETPCPSLVASQEGLRKTIHPHDLDVFERRVQTIPLEMEFGEAWNKYVGLRTCFKMSVESWYDIQRHFYKAREKGQKLRSLLKVEDPGCFMIPCTINGTSVYNCLCDSGAGTSLIPTNVATRCGITKYHPSNVKLYMANETVCLPRGELHDEMVRIGNVNVPTDFQVVDMPGKRQQIIFGRAFLTTVGAVLDAPNRRVCFANIDKDVFYHATRKGNLVRPVRLEEGRSVRISGDLSGGPVTRSQTRA